MSVDRLALQVLRKRGPKIDPLVEGIRSGGEEELHVLRNGVAVLCAESHGEIMAGGALGKLVELVGPACIEALLTNLDVRKRPHLLCSWLSVACGAVRPR